MRIGHDNAPYPGDEKLDREIVENEIAEDSVDKKAAGIIHKEVSDTPKQERSGLTLRAIEAAWKASIARIKEGHKGGESGFLPWVGGKELNVVYDAQGQEAELIFRDPVTKKIIYYENEASYRAFSNAELKLLNRLFYNENDSVRAILKKKTAR